ARDAVGSAIVATLEGSRPMLVEVQALTTPTVTPAPRRTANGLDVNRLILVSAVLSRRLSLPLASEDIIASVVGGLRVREPAADLALALAIVSSQRDKPLTSDIIALGEIGLSGELPSVSPLERRATRHSSLPRLRRRGDPLRRHRPQVRERRRRAGRRSGRRPHRLLRRQLGAPQRSPPSLQCRARRGRGARARLGADPRQVPAIQVGRLGAADDARATHLRLAAVGHPPSRRSMIRNRRGQGVSERDAQKLRRVLDKDFSADILREVEGVKIAKPALWVYDRIV